MKILIPLITLAYMHPPIKTLASSTMPVRLHYCTIISQIIEYFKLLETTWPSLCGENWQEIGVKIYKICVGELIYKVLIQN